MKRLWIVVIACLICCSLTWIVGCDMAAEDEAADYSDECEEIITHTAHWACTPIMWSEESELLSDCKDNYHKHNWDCVYDNCLKLYDDAWLDCLDDCFEG